MSSHRIAKSHGVRLRKSLLLIISHRATLRSDANSSRYLTLLVTIGVIRLPVVINRKRYRDEIASALKVVAVRVAHHTILRDL